MLDLQGEGVNFDNLWSGPGIPFGGSLIMMTLDIFLYGYLAYYLDSVIPSTIFFSTVYRNTIILQKYSNFANYKNIFTFK